VLLLFGKNGAARITAGPLRGETGSDARRGGFHRAACPRFRREHGSAGIRRDMINECPGEILMSEQYLPLSSMSFRKAGSSAV
jgi:hypothetical protein